MNIIDNKDRIILQELRRNCRISHRGLAKICGISAPAIRARIQNLEQTGVITNYLIQYCLEMAKADAYLIEVHTDGSEKVDDFVRLIGTNSMISEVCWSGLGEYIIIAYCLGVEGAAVLSDYIRSFSPVSMVKPYPLMFSRGQSRILTKSEKRVVEEMSEDPRLSVPDIAKRSGISTKTIRKIISTMNGTLFRFTLSWNPSAGINTGYIMKLQLRESPKTERFLIKLETQSIKNRILETYRCAIEPVLYVLVSPVTMIDYKKILCELRRFEEISKLSFITCVSWYSFPNILWINYRTILC